MDIDGYATHPEQEIWTTMDLCILSKSGPQVSTDVRRDLLTCADIRTRAKRRLEASRAAHLGGEVVAVDENLGAIS